MRKKILTVIGARPQFVKAFVLSKSLQNLNGVEEVILNTGQHYDSNMSDVFVNALFPNPPKYNLGIHGGTHGGMTGRMLIEVEKVLLQEQPDLLLVYGDTNSTLAGALAAVKMHVPVAHVEAGLRSYDPRMPEEINRVTTDAMSNILFCPSESAQENLLKEGIFTGNQVNQQVFVTGDVMLDALDEILLQSKKTPHGSAEISSEEYFVCTIHRSANTDSCSALQNVFGMLGQIAEGMGQKGILPIHPRTRKRIEEWGINPGESIQVVDPLPYSEFCKLVHQASFVVTDSGGLQKEAAWLGKKCITLRDSTEWIETIKLGINFLMTSAERVNGALEFLRLSVEDQSIWQSVRTTYGRGKASEEICKKISNFF